MNEREALNRALEQRITDYLSAGGLFNPELADHVAVRDLLIDCRKALAQPEQEPVYKVTVVDDQHPDGIPLEQWWQQTEQKPVAWMCKRDDGHFDVLTDQTCKKCFPVYTTPPQRKPLPKSENSKHKYNPHKKYPWFCADCGYAEHELLMHTAAHGIKE